MQVKRLALLFNWAPERVCVARHHSSNNVAQQYDPPWPVCAICKWPFILNHKPAKSPSLTRQMQAASGRWFQW